MATLFHSELLKNCKNLDRLWFFSLAINHWSQSVGQLFLSNCSPSTLDICEWGSRAETQLLSCEASKGEGGNMGKKKAFLVRRRRCHGNSIWSIRSASPDVYGIAPLSTGVARVASAPFESQITEMHLLVIHESMYTKIIENYRGFQVILNS